MDEVTGDIGSSGFTVTHAWDPDDDKTEMYWTRIYWDERQRIEWETDIVEGPGLSPASSAPVYGWASWFKSDDVLVAYCSYDAEMEGWVRIPNGAPDYGAEDREEAILEPERWVQFARTLARAIGGHIPGLPGESY